MQQKVGLGKSLTISMSKIDIIITIVAVSLLVGLLCSFIVSFIMIYQKKKKQHLFEKQVLNARFSETLLQSQLEIQEQTFKNISQEIHDNIGQALTLAKLNLNTLDAELDEAPMQKIITSKEIISKAINDLRDIGRSLNTDYIADMGLLKAMEYELGLISRSSGIKTELHTEGDPFRMDQQKELILFRIVQETLNNTMKHAGAKTIRASIGFQSDKLELSVDDDGKGFVLPGEGNENQLAAGLGLRNMQNRAKLIGATFSINSALGDGTAIKIILPK